MKLYLVRHTAVDMPQGVCYGQTDVPLKETFFEEASVVNHNLSYKKVDAVFSSPLSRCRRLAAFCGYGNAVLDSRLKELNFGDWELKRWDSIDMSVWRTDWINSPAPNGESFVQMYKRVTSFFDDLKNRHHGSVVVFTHGGVINCARVYFEQIDMEKAFELKAMYGQIVEFTV